MVVKHFKWTYIEISDFLIREIVVPPVEELSLFFVVLQEVVCRRVGVIIIGVYVYHAI